MFNRPDFSDLYKFLTSIGIILIFAAFVLPWLYLKSDSGLLLNGSEYNELYSNSKQLLQKRISLNLLFTSMLPWISLGLFISGSLVTYIGVRKWYPKQKEIDEIDSLKLVKMRAEAKPLNEDEVMKKAEDEVEQEIKTALNPDSNKDFMVAPVLTPEQYKETMNKFDMSMNLRYLEGLFYDKLVDYNPFEYKIDQNLSIGGKYEIDISLTAFNPKKHEDRLIEIQYQQTYLSMELVRNGYKKFREAYSYYVNSTKRETKMTFIIVYKDDIAGEEETKRFRQAVQDFEREINYPKLKIFVINHRNVPKTNMEVLIGW